MAKLTDKELNEKLMESLNITTADAKNAFNALMTEKYKELKQEARKEVYEELSKQAKQDKEKIIESMDKLSRQTINEEMKKIDIHRKNLIKEKLALKEAKANVAKEIADKTAIIQENFNKKLKTVQENLQQKFDEDKAKFIDTASKWLNETVKKEMTEHYNDRKQLGEALDTFGKFISEQINVQVKEHKNEMKSLDKLRVRLVQEQKDNIATAKKEFFADAASKMQKFMQETITRELKQFRQDIAENRKKAFGMKIFESFAREFAIKFFNEDKVVKSMLESVKASQNKLMHSNKVLEKQLNEAKNQINQLSTVNNKLSREKIINESVSHLTKDKQDMMRNLVAEVPTEKLNESINKYLPMILNGSSQKQINKNERVLKEGKKVTFLTGENKNRKNAMDLNESNLSSDLEEEIAKVIANCQF